MLIFAYGGCTDNGSMRLLDNWTGPRDGELAVGFIVAREGERLLCLGEDEMAVRVVLAKVGREPPERRRWLS